MQQIVLELADQPDEVRAAVLDCEVRARRTLFARGGRPVALLVSWDEYLALAETVALSGDPELLERVRAGEAALEAGRAGSHLGGATARALWVAEPASASLDPARSAEVDAALAELGANAIAGVPLSDPLRGFWSYRAGDLRVVYRLTREGDVGVVEIGWAGAPA